MSLVLTNSSASFVIIMVSFVAKRDPLIFTRFSTISVLMINFKNANLKIHNSEDEGQGDKKEKEQQEKKKKKNH